MAADSRIDRAYPTVCQGFASFYQKGFAKFRRWSIMVKTARDLLASPLEIRVFN